MVKKFSSTPVLYFFIALIMGFIPKPATADQAAESSAALGSVLIIDEYAFTRDFSKLKAFPTFSLAAPSGLTPNQNVVFLGIGGILNVPGQTTNADGSMTVGIGMGISEEKLVGALLTLDLGSINPVDGQALDRGNLGLAVGKYFDNYATGVALGVKAVSLWQGGDGRNIPSFYLAATKIITTDNFLAIINGGVGNNAFRTIRDTSTGSNRASKISAFGSVAIYPLPQLSLVADYTAGIVSLGVGIVPIAAWPVSLSFGVYDVNKAVSGHTQTSYIGSLSVSYSF